MADAVFFRSSFGGVPMLISHIETELGRDVAVQSPSRGDRHVLQDRGRAHRVANVEILFVPQPGLDPYDDRYRDFAELVNAGQAQIFSHPLDGRYRARASNLRVTSQDGTGEIRCSVTFLAEDEPDTVFPLGAGVSPTAGAEAVATGAANADTELAAIGMSTTVTSLASTSVTAWSQDDSLDPQTVFAGVGTLTSKISDAVDALDAGTNLSHWLAYQALVNLSYQVIRAGEALTSTAGRLFEIAVTAPKPLLAICAEIYGASEAQDKASQVAQLNRVRTPARVPKGTTLKMPPVGS